MKTRSAEAKHSLRFLKVAVGLVLVSRVASFHTPTRTHRRKTFHAMVLKVPSDFKRQNKSISCDSSTEERQKSRKNVKRKYKRKRVPDSEKEARTLRRERQAEFEQILTKSPNIWSFESLFPDPVLDEEAIKRDLFEVRERDSLEKEAPVSSKQNPRGHSRMKSSFYGGSSMMRIWRDPKLSSSYLPYDTLSSAVEPSAPPAAADNQTSIKEFDDPAPSLSQIHSSDTYQNLSGTVDRDLTRMVEDRIFGYRRTQRGDFEYDTSLMGNGAVKFRDGVRLGNPLSVNADRLNYFAKKELQRGRVEEAQEFYETAIEIDPRDGRAYLGMSRCAQRRRDFKLARAWLQTGIQKAVSSFRGNPDRGANPFLLQALGCLEEKMGRLSKAEALFVSAVKSRPSHAAAWVSLAQLRTRKLGQSASAGRKCLQTCEKEILAVGGKPPAHLYTTWASIEQKKAKDARRARELYKKALEIDPKSSVGWLQLGVMECNCGNWKEAEACFETVLKFDQRNTRVLQAYALMETKRPDGNSRKAIGLFERALLANPRDAGVLQAYGLYVAELGDVDAARNLLKRGTETDKRHVPVWQAWGVLETRFGTAEDARYIFQQGIWSCAQLNGSQSGGYHCARLWQAWGVLEAKEDEYAAARRCFSRALDADNRNIAAIIAWAQMEANLGNEQDARLLLEGSLPKFSAASDEKLTLWRAYELMEQNFGNKEAAQAVYQRAMRETISVTDDSSSADEETPQEGAKSGSMINTQTNKEIEVLRWGDGGSMVGEVWMNDRAIEGKLPYNVNKKRHR